VDESEYDVHDADEEHDGERDEQASVCAGGEGERLGGDGWSLRVRASYPQLDLVEFETAGDWSGPRAHYHARHVDAFYVLHGELEFRVAGENLIAAAGTSVVVPPGVVHAFSPRGDDARFLNVHAPGIDFVELNRRYARGEQVAESDYDVHDVENGDSGSS
jgi:mannose-6-phosphate isomerase-like protein (cupin superfamily)